MNGYLSYGILNIPDEILKQPTEKIPNGFRTPPYKFPKMDDLSKMDVLSQYRSFPPGLSPQGLSPQDSPPSSPQRNNDKNRYDLTEFIKLSTRLSVLDYQNIIHIKYSMKN